MVNTILNRKKWTRMFVFSLTFILALTGAVSAYAADSGEKVGSIDITNAIKQNLSQVQGDVGAFATLTIDWSIPGNSTATGTTGLPMESGESITINVSYSPSASSVQAGIIQPDGSFRYVNGSRGSVNHEFSISQRGTYYVAIVNSSSNTLTVTGFVNY
ncbi:hypothetical protein [Bacillus horti]|uniref:Uncharacterized protein n=1 Tax=Caldalkalibacillus horti TaxID=77523 RepID=A0ABT9W451_9BACI|nr:hypothetical protein [Bacillus horti]MDQ0168025.1 hypothetical protein [Bacillus horti]